MAEEKATRKVVVLRGFQHDGRKYAREEITEIPRALYSDLLYAQKVIDADEITPLHRADLAAYRARHGLSEKAVSTKRAGAERAAS